MLYKSTWDEFDFYISVSHRDSVIDFRTYSHRELYFQILSILAARIDITWKIREAWNNVLGITSYPLRYTRWLKKNDIVKIMSNNTSRC